MDLSQTEQLDELENRFVVMGQINELYKQVIEEFLREHPTLFPNLTRNRFIDWVLDLYTPDPTIRRHS